MEQQRPDFVDYSGSVTTPDGEKLCQFIESQFKEADQTNDVVALNGVLSGHIGHYYTNVYKLGLMTPARWLYDFKESFAAAAWRDMQWFAAQAAQAQQVQETAQQATDIAAQLEALQEQLGDALARINELEGEKEPAVQKPASKAKSSKAKAAEAVKDEPTAEESESGGDEDAETEEPTEDNEAEDASEEA